MLVDFKYFEKFDFMIYRAFVAISCILSLFVAVRPVVMMSMSISPVVGSVAACCMANFIRLMAPSTSDSSTYCANLILAKA